LFQIGDFKGQQEKVSMETALKGHLFVAVVASAVITMNKLTYSLFLA
jgi:hypothetical protein